jgi:DNA-directed RNA polymerase specialized sigma24 family protein
MVSSAILTVVKYIHNFDVEKSNNPFAYISTICSRAFLQYIAYSNRHGEIKKYLYGRKPKSYFDDTEYYNTKAIDYEAIKDWSSKDDDE